MLEPKSIIVADPDPLIRGLIHRMLATGIPGAAIREAGNGDDALDLLDETVVCVLAEVDMPGRDGISVCRAIRGTAPFAPFRAVPVVLMSARGLDEAIALRAWNAGTALLLPKPFHPMDLLRIVSGAPLHPSRLATGTARVVPAPRRLLPPIEPEVSTM